MKKEKNIFMKKLSDLLKKIKDLMLNWIERWAGKLHNWAWDKRWKERDHEEWLQGYRKWKQTRCPHN